MQCICMNLVHVHISPMTFNVYFFPHLGASNTYRNELNKINFWHSNSMEYINDFSQKGGWGGGGSNN